jgi:hypothetical protein
MTAEGLAVSTLEETGWRPRDRARVVACAFCRKRLADEYFFTCRKCDASYCYIHTSRHQPALCARQVGRLRRAQAAATEARRAEDFPLRGANQLLMAEPRPGGGSSANV